MTSRTLILRILVSLLLLVGLALVTWAIWPHLGVFTNRDELNRVIAESGIFGPLIFIILQAIQVIIAPIPATIVTLAGGYVFGAFLGTVYSMIGTTLGFWAVFYISKKFGRKIIRFMISEEKMHKYDELTANKSMLAFVVFGFLFPFLPDAVIGYIAGLTVMKIKSLVILSIITRIPGALMTSYVGSKVGSGDYTLVVILVILVAIILAVAHYKREAIYAYIDTFHAWMLGKPLSKKKKK